MWLEALFVADGGAGIMGPGASSGVFEALHNDFRASQLSLSSFSSSDSANILR
jgi:hypothetical protein